MNLTPKSEYVKFTAITHKISNNLELQDSIKPEKVEFSSVNFNSVLQWQPGRHISSSTVYFVQYKMYGEKEWIKKMECWGIDEFFCDLTQETSDVREPYYGRVKAVSSGIHSDWNTSWRFIPWWETKIGPPLLKMNPCNRSIEVEIKAPSSPYKGKNGRKISMKKYYDLSYRVFITHNSMCGTHKLYEGKNRIIKIENLTPGTKCCFIAETYLPVLDRSSEHSSELCTVPLVKVGVTVLRQWRATVSLFFTHATPLTEKFLKNNTLLNVSLYGPFKEHHYLLPHQKKLHNMISTPGLLRSGPYMLELIPRGAQDYLYFRKHAEAWLFSQAFNTYGN
uniref:Interleukin-22 receptor subunit alpha-2-like n=1 Tax=Geotrypetes seraphini TaxID=260995 RepID=A0A6P8R0I3_GEOSA|nr:interleukin-22 receptor subunit alpha-2-like [Geotrypetes seraphini]